MEIRGSELRSSSREREPTTQRIVQFLQLLKIANEGRQSGAQSEEVPAREYPSDGSKLIGRLGDLVAASSKSEPAGADLSLARGGESMHLAKIMTGADDMCIEAGGIWPRGSADNDLRVLFNNATPLSLRGLAPEGQGLPIDVGHATVPPTEAGETAAARLRGLSGVMPFGLTEKLFNAYFSGEGRNYGLEKKHTNEIFDELTEPGRQSLDAPLGQINAAIRQQISETGETSGRIRGVTDWQTASASGFVESLGRFSTKLLYDFTYELGPDGALHISGKTAMAVQDLYDFSAGELWTPIPASIVPEDFRDRAGFTTQGGNLTDRAVAELQKEGHATPFYVYGVSDERNVDIAIASNGDASWSAQD